ncbi:MAG: hypothetical protein OXC18_18505 [Desulfurellaceae bacterium]|nr:hypothetical protein [Desulfurellaceae bacterium]
MNNFLWSLTAAGSLIGMVILGVGLMSVESAPQEAAIAAIALACAVLPYCLARAASELK